MKLVPVMGVSGVSGIGGKLKFKEKREKQRISIPGPRLYFLRFRKDHSHNETKGCPALQIMQCFEHCSKGEGGSHLCKKNTDFVLAF